MTNYNYDVAFIGGGHANWHAAMTLRQAGLKIAIFEKDTIGGTCTNYGCNAKILLDGPADVLHQIKSYENNGLVGNTKIDWPALMAYKHANIDHRHLELEGMFKKAGIDLINGHAQFINAHTITVEDQLFTADKIVLGTGLRPRTLDIPGSEYIHDSRDFLDMPNMPAHITFLGTGIVSMEFASLASMAGAKVTIINRSEHILKEYPQKYVAKIRQSLIDAGVEFIFNAEVVDVLKINDDHLTLNLSDNNKVETNYILNAVGRIPNIENMGLAKIGVQTNNHGIVVNEFLQTTVANIYASGDVVSNAIPKLTPTATFESNYLAQLFLGMNKRPIGYPAIAQTLFTLPRISQVGVALDVAQVSDEYTVQTVPYGKMFLFSTKNEDQAEVNFIFDKEQLLVGATVFGDEAPELINILALIISQKMTATDLQSVIFAFPSQSIGLISVLARYLKVR